MALLAGVASAIAWLQLRGARGPVGVRTVQVGAIPVTLFAPRDAPARPPPVVVLAHGFAGSQQLLQPYALTLARNGYLAVSFDLPGHGRNPTPIPGGFAQQEQRDQALVAALAQVVDAVADQARAGGGLALLGHSMGSHGVLAYALGPAAELGPPLRAVVAISPFDVPGASATRPPNLLLLAGALEPRGLKDAALAVVGLAAGGGPEPGITYGDFGAGTARRLDLAPGAEHIGVLYSQAGLRAALDWLDRAFQRPGGGDVVNTGPWLVLLFAGIVALAWPLSRLLPVVRPAPGDGPGPDGWRRLLVAVLVPAALTPVLAHGLTALLPAPVLPLLLADYLVWHFALYGLLTLALRRWWPPRREPRTGEGPPRPPWVLAVAVAAAGPYAVLALALPLDQYVATWIPTADRLPALGILLLGTLPYFLADEALTRRHAGPGWAYAATKACFILSLMLAVALDVYRLFFLIIILPALLLFFLIHGLFSRWAWQRTGHPAVAGCANALAFAWAMAVTFPRVLP